MDNGGISRERPRKPNVIAIEKCDIFAASLAGTIITCSTWTFVFLSQDSHPRMLLQDRHRLVSRAVIDHDGFVILELLCSNRFECRLDELGAIISRNDDGKEHQLPKSTLLPLWLFPPHSRGGFNNLRCAVKPPRLCS